MALYIISPADVAELNIISAEEFLSIFRTPKVYIQHKTQLNSASGVRSQSTIRKLPLCRKPMQACIIMRGCARPKLYCFPIWAGRIQSKFFLRWRRFPAHRVYDRLSGCQRFSTSLSEHNEVCLGRLTSCSLCTMLFCLLHEQLHPLFSTSGLCFIITYYYAKVKLLITIVAWPNFPLMFNKESQYHTTVFALHILTCNYLNNWNVCIVLKSGCFRYLNKQPRGGF